MHPLLERAHRVLRDCAGGLTPDALARRPAGRWSSADILEHLGLTFAATTRGLRRLVDHGPADLPAPRFQQRLATLLVVHAGYFPSGRASPEPLRPRGADPGTVLDDTLARLTAMDAALDGAELKFGPRIRVMPHPVLGPLSVHEWRRFHWVHTRHHARQIRGRQR
jgi:hypothetical protein